jgi:hypothetical protein
MRHNGYGATGRSSLPKGKPMNLVTPDGFASSFYLAQEVKRAAAQLGMPAGDVLALMRRDGVIDCNDAGADAILRLCANQ